MRYSSSKLRRAVRKLMDGLKVCTFLALVVVCSVVFFGTPIFAENVIQAEQAIQEELVVEQPVVSAKGLKAAKDPDASSGIVVRGQDRSEASVLVAAVPANAVPADAAPIKAFKEKWEGNLYDKRHNKYLKYDKDGQIDASPEVVPLDYLPRDSEGFIDWTKAMRDGLLKPLPTITAKPGQEMVTVRYDKDVILRPSKTFMPDVIFPHDAHNDWLNCGNCHDGIFKMKKKASGITMKRIWKGEFCGRCHDKVAFPLRHCFRCHAGERGTTFAEPEAVPDNFIEYEEY